MKIVTDKSAHDDLQRALLRALARTILDGLPATILTPRQRADITEALTFDVAALLDGSAYVEHAGEPVTPIVMFATDDPPDEVITSGGATFMHEYAAGTVEEVVREASAEAPEGA